MSGKKTFIFRVQTVTDSKKGVIIVFLISAVTFFKEPCQTLLQKAFAAAPSRSVEPFILCTIHTVDTI